jgi:hypothetical protein
VSTRCSGPLVNLEHRDPHVEDPQPFGAAAVVVAAAGHELTFLAGLDDLDYEQRAREQRPCLRSWRGQEQQVRGPDRALVDELGRRDAHGAVPARGGG